MAAGAGGISSNAKGERLSDGNAKGRSANSRTTCTQPNKRARKCEHRTTPSTTSALVRLTDNSSGSVPNTSANTKCSSAVFIQQMFSWLRSCNSHRNGHSFRRNERCKPAQPRTVMCTALMRRNRMNGLCSVNKATACAQRNRGVSAGNKHSHANGTLAHTHR